MNWNTNNSLFKTIKLWQVWIICMVLIATPSKMTAKSSSEQHTEYELKAAYISNFIKLTDWPKETFKQKTNPLVIGVFREVQYSCLSRILEGKKKNGHPFHIVYLKKQDIESAEKVKRCQVLFIPATLDQSDEETVFKHTKNQSILTIGERKNFLEDGGIINFVWEEKKIRFEINLIKSEQARLKIRAKLIRLAKRVIKKDDENPEKSRP